MRRREFIGTLAGGAVGALPFRLLGAEKVYRIGYLTANLRNYPWVDGFVRELRGRGYSEGINLTIEWREAKGKPELLPQMVADLVQMNVDVIVVVSNFAGLLVQKATNTIPVVVLASHDGVEMGLYASLSRPGANVTGIDSLAPELDAKRVEFLKEIVPKLSRLALFYNPLFPGAGIHLNSVRSASERLGIELRPVEARSGSDLGSALASIVRDRPDAIITLADPLFLFERQKIVDFARQQNIPDAHEFREFVQIGGLLSYGATFDGMWRRGAYYVDKILKGTKPSELPVELPTEFNLSINLKIAKALSLAVPPTLLSLANEVIE